MIGGFANAGECRFVEGDWVRVEGVVDGEIESADLRCTLVRRFDRALVHVRNAQLANAALTNFSRRERRRIKWKVSLKYSTPGNTLEKICDEIAQFIREDKQFVAPEMPPSLSGYMVLQQAPST